MNKQRFVRSFSFVLTVCMVVMLLGACSNSKETTSKDKNETKGNIEGTENVLSKYTPQDKTYEFSYVPGGVAPADKDAPIVKYFEKLLNVKFNFVFLEPSKKDELLNLKFASGDIPDIFSGSVANMYEYEKQDLLTEIPEEVFREYCPVHAKEFDKNYNMCWDLSKVNGKMYGLPAMDGNMLFRKPTIWRTDWLEKVGIKSIPSTLDEAEKAFYMFRNNDPDNNGKKDTYALSKEGINAVFGAYGIVEKYWVEKNGKIEPSEIQPETKQALKKLAKWYKDELIDPEFITGENSGGYWALTHSFISGKIGFTAMGNYYHWKPSLYTGDFFGQNAQEMSITNPTAKYEIGSVLKGPDGKGYMRQGDLVCGITFISRNLRNQPDKVAKFLQVANAVDGTRDAYITSYYGFKDVHYTVDSTGRINQKEPYTDVKELSKIGGHCTFGILGLPEHMFAGYVGWDKWAVEKGLDKDGMFNALSVPLPSDSNYKSELQKLWQETYIDIVTGEKPIDYFDEFVKEYKKDGGDKLIKEANDWYSAK